MEESYFGGGHTSLGWQNPDKSAAAAATAALQANCAAAEQLQPFLTLNWNQHQQSDQGTAPGVTHFHQSHLTSAAPSPAPHHLLSQAAASLVNDSAAFRELLGRLNPGGGEISQWANFPTAACFNPPPHSFAPALHTPTTHSTLPTTAAATQLSSLAVDPGFVERAARFSSFCGGLPGQFPLPELPTVPPISPTMRPGPGGGGGSHLGVADNNEISVMSRSSTPEDAEFRGVRDDSPSGSDHKFSYSNSKKRKPDAPPPVSRIPLKAVAEEDVSAKRMKPTETFANGKDELSPKLEGNAGANSSGGGDGSRKQGKENNSNTKAAEPPKDYIHVRARRGQATDSHSLAERVRREKISQRMKFLQDLVPGCNKVTGKAVMLDEIINYVQSLQRQVEFLSMKLATVNPQMDFNSSSLLQKDMYQQPRASLPNTVFQMESSSSLPFPFAQPPPVASQDGHHLQHNNNVVSSGGIESHLLNPMDSTLKRPLNGGVQLPAALDGFGGASSRVGGSFMEDDLHSVVQMGLGQGQEDSFSSRPFQGK